MGKDLNRHISKADIQMVHEKCTGTWKVPNLTDNQGNAN